LTFSTLSLNAVSLAIVVLVKTLWDNIVETLVFLPLFLENEGHFDANHDVWSFVD
jgi:hypothetical protein